MSFCSRFAFSMSFAGDVNGSHGRYLNFKHRDLRQAPTSTRGCSGKLLSSFRFSFCDKKKASKQVSRLLATHRHRTMSYRARHACMNTQRHAVQLTFIFYRVSIKSFPDYKHLLQENYVEYKHIFLPLLKAVSKILCHVFIVMLQLHNYKFEGKNNRRFCYNN